MKGGDAAPTSGASGRRCGILHGTREKRMTRKSLLIVGLLVVAGTASAQQQRPGSPPEASNMRLVGWNDLQARSAYQPTIHRQGDRWIAYVGHHGGSDEIPTPVNPMTDKP